MPSLQLTLLGRPFLTIDGQALESTLFNKGLALVAYLGMVGKPQSRAHLAGLLWSELDEDRARRNLRVELARIKPHVGEFLLAERRIVGIEQSERVEVDARQFANILSRPNLTVEQLETAVSLYKGSFLSDLIVRDAPLFEEWVLVQRERLRQTMLDALLKLTRSYTESGAYEKGITAVRKLLTIEPWLESGHRQLMLLLALNGQRAAALAQYDTCAQLLMAELGVNPSPETDALYDDIESGKHDPGTQSPNPPINLRTRLPIPFQPLPQLDYFVGRESEAKTLRHWLTQPNGPHFAALVGMGGIGKTTLANQIAHSLRTEFADGVLWADAVAGEPFDILDGWGKAYGFDFSGLNDVENRAAAVRGMLADKQALIVIDDIFELSRIRPLLPNGEACAVLLTTRNLEIAVTLNAKVIQLETLSAENGRDLLSNIIGNQRIADESEAADDIGSLLEYHPLAMEICAQRLKSRRRRRLVDMSAQLRDVQNRLDLEISDRAVRTSFEVSWEGLDFRQQGVFSKLAVFESRPFASDAVAEITAQNRYKAEDILDALHALSLVREEGDIHYRLHALLADFALEKLGKALSEVNGRMASYYQMYGQTNQTNYDALSLEWPNISAGMRVAHKQENWPLVLTYGETMVEPWFAQARFADIQTGMAWVKEAAEATDDEATLAYFEMKWGQASIERNEYETAVLHLENSFERFQQLDNPARLAEIQFNLARVAIEQNEYEHALDLLMESKQIRQNLSDQKGVAAILYREARVWNAFGPDLNRAEQLAQEALVIQTELQDSYWQINSLRLLTEIEITRKNPEKGLHYSEQALEINTRLQNKGEQAAILYNLSSVYRQMAQFDKAIEVANESLEIFKQMGNLRFQGFLHYSMAMIYQNQNIFDNALLACKECINIFKALGDHTSTVYGLVLWGDCYQAIGQQATAVSKWEQAKEIAIGLTNATFVKMITSRLASVSTD